MGLALVRADTAAREITQDRLGRWVASPVTCVCQARSYETALCVAERAGYVRVPIAQIQRIEAAKDYAIIHAAGRRHILRITMGELAQRVDPAQLMRVRRSAFVRLEAVRRVTRTGRGPMQLHLEDGAVVDVGPTYAKAVTRALRLQS
ncbi:MAG: hypothetical protein C0481_07215 [Phenylobacterium sp.]|nr:hypothetical protein [Phenylobacterium sp.]